MKITPELQAFFVSVESKARKNGVECVLRQDLHLPYPNTSTLVNGYFVDMPKRTFAVAMGKSLEQWLPVYVHESSHMDQCIEESPAWKERLVPGTIFEALDMIQLWVDRKIELTETQLSDYIHRARNMEWDCERRSAAKIRESSLPLDERAYIQKANSCLYFYTAMKELRSRYEPGKEPYNTSEVYTLCPGIFLPEAKYELVPMLLMDRYRKLLKK